MGILQLNEDVSVPVFDASYVFRNIPRDTCE